MVGSGPQWPNLFFDCRHKVSLMRIRSFIVLLLFIVAVCFIGVSAQTQKTTSQALTTSKSTAALETRTRRTTTSSAQTTGPEAAASLDLKTTPPTPAGSSTQEPEKKSTAPTPEKEKAAPSPQPTVPADPIAGLRTQINAAPTGTERNTLRLKLVEELLSADKKSEALSELRSLVNTDVFDPQSFYNAGNSFARLGDADGAIQAYRKAIDQRKGRYSRALNNLGVVLLRAGRWDESYEALTSALKLESFRYPEASYNLGRLYAARGENDLAIREWRRVLVLNPNHTAAAEALANIGTEGRVVIEAPRASSASKTTAVSARSSEKPVAVKPVSANASAVTSLVLDPTSFELLQRARTESEKGKTLAAIDTYKRLLMRRNGYFPLANLELSFALIRSQRLAEAFGNLQMVATRDGGRYPISYYHLARVYESNGDLKQAESWFTQAATAFGKRNAQFLLDVSRVREKQGNYRGALEAMERYLSIMNEQGEQPSWSTERLTALRDKVAKP